MAVFKNLTKLQLVLGQAIFFSLFWGVATLISIYHDGSEFEPKRFVILVIYWFCGGAVLGYLSWEAINKNK
jgi:hypothetical protein